MSQVGRGYDINKTFIIEPQSLTGFTPTLTGCSGVYTNEIISCSGDTVIKLTDGETIINTNLTPVDDGDVSVGTQIKRFRELNSISGRTSIWVVTTKVETPELLLGVDSSGNTRTITANNSIIQDDILLGGTY